MSPERTSDEDGKREGEEAEKQQVFDEEGESQWRVSEQLRQAQELTGELRRSLPSKVEAREISLIAKIPYKVAVWKGVLLHRCADLAGESCRLFAEGSILPAAIITRSLMETAGMLAWLAQRMKGVSESSDLDDFDRLLMRGLLGDSARPAKSDTSAERIIDQPLSGLSAVDKADRELDGFRDMYDDLCQFVHPNWSGNKALYSLDDPEDMTTKLSLDVDVEPLRHLLIPLIFSLVCIRRKRAEIDSLMDDFIALCERDIRQGDH